MKYSEQVILKRWIPILKEYERTKAKLTPRQFKFVKDLCQAHHISRKELSRYYRKWIEGGRRPGDLEEARGDKSPDNEVKKKVESEYGLDRRNKLRV